MCFLINGMGLITRKFFASAVCNEDAFTAGICNANIKKCIFELCQVDNKQPATISQIQNFLKYGKENFYFF